MTDLIEQQTGKPSRELEVVGLSAFYGQARALAEITLSVAPGEVVGLLGRNGAGKTTLLNSIAGLHPVKSGRIILHGQDVSRLSASERSRLGVSLVREGGMLPLSLTVTENLMLGSRLARLRGAQSRPLDEVFERFPLLSGLRDRRAGVLSGGERQSLALATAYASDPKLLLLDEPSAGLSPHTARLVFNTIGQLARDSKLTFLIVEQNPVWLEGLSHQNYLLEVGKIVGEGRVKQILGRS